ncbi:MAG: hypothetical protein PVI75_01835 [Gammaproteobacteria bacterium]
MRADVDVNTIRAWFGHVSINTTNIYAEVDIEMKAKALALCEIVEIKQKLNCNYNKSLKGFLDAF